LGLSNGLLVRFPSALRRTASGAGLVMQLWQREL
jgi:hypothetical protein